MSSKYLGETFDIHGGGMDLMFPHHENELAQSESATGKTFARFWLHNGLTRIKTKLSSGEVKDEKMSKSLGNVVGATELLAEQGPELVRYLLLSTHYRRPIEFTPEVIDNVKKAMAVFSRLAERLERLAGSTPADESSGDIDAVASRLLESEIAPFIRDVLNDKMRFLEMMDDDFNTAGAIGVLHELAGRINAFIEQNKAEAAQPVDVLEAAAAATRTLQKLGNILGLFRTGMKRVETKSEGLADKLMELIITIRNDARKTKNFAVADAVRDGLKKLSITLEDRPEGTGWRKE
jgi:cysteinyl-tRNA synthetase